MCSVMEARRWSRRTFAGAKLGDARRTARLVAMGARAATHPDGRVSHSIRGAAERQAAYDFLESGRGSHRAIVGAMGESTARLCRGFDHVLVPVDASALSLLDAYDDPARARDFGLVGSARDGVRGVHVVSALVLSPQGVVLGVGDMRWWARGLTPHRRCRARRESLPLARTELGRWAEAIETTRERLQTHAPGVTPWFHLDRGGDSWRLMVWLHEGGYHFTVRARANRNVLATRVRAVPSSRSVRGRRPVEPAKNALRRHACLGTMKVTVPRRDDRPAREASLQVRAARVTLMLRNPCASQPVPVPVWAVWARETGRPPRGAERIEWLLWTTEPVASLADAARVVGNYVLRWRIESWHRAWKSDCNAERMELHSVEAAARWGSILGAVAARIEGLKQLARTTPDRPAATELSASELRALVVLKRMEARKNETIEDNPTLGRAVRWIADLGGYDGRPATRPPGATVIARGLQSVMLVAKVLETLESDRQ